MPCANCMRWASSPLSAADRAPSPYLRSLRRRCDEFFKRRTRHDRDARFALSTFISKAISDDGYRRVARCFIVSLIAVATLRNYQCCRESILSQNYRVFVGRRHDPLFVSGQRPTLGSPGFIRLAYDHSSALIMSFSDKFSLGWNTSKHYDVLRLGQTDNALFRALQSDTY